jgi:anti-sigma factor ChrR (cupin superfamily)
VVRTFSFTLEEEGDWIELKPGVHQKMLVSAAGEDGSMSYLIRMAPGTFVASHPHERFEHCYVIAGDLEIAGRHIHGGDYHYAPRGSVHESPRSHGGCLLLIVEAP